MGNYYSYYMGYNEEPKSHVLETLGPISNIGSGFANLDKYSGMILYFLVNATTSNNKKQDYTHRFYLELVRLDPSQLLIRCPNSTNLAILRKVESETHEIKYSNKYSSTILTFTSDGKYAKLTWSDTLGSTLLEFNGIEQYAMPNSSFDHPLTGKSGVFEAKLSSKQLDKAQTETQTRIYKFTQFFDWIIITSSNSDYLLGKLEPNPNEKFGTNHYPPKYDRPEQLDSKNYWYYHLLNTWAGGFFCGNQPDKVRGLPNFEYPHLGRMDRKSYPVELVLLGSGLPYISQEAGTIRYV